MKRTVTVVGTAAVSVPPDHAQLHCGVQVSGVNAQDALNRSNQAIEAILNALAESGVGSSDVRTSGPNLYPTDGGYTGSNDVTVEIRDVGAVGRVIDTVAQTAGPNLTMHGVSFSVADAEAHLPALRQAAVADAQRIARELASAAGAKLGEVVTISEPSGSWSPFPAASARMLKSTPVEAGSQELRVSVNVMYRLRDR